MPCEPAFSSLKPLVIVGAGGLGREVAWLVHDINAVSPQWRLLGFVDGDASQHGTMLAGYPVLGGDDWLAAHTDVHVVIAVGSAQVRQRIAHSLRPLNLRYATLVHPDATVAKFPGQPTTLGAGCIVCARSVVSINVTLGDHVVVYWMCTVGHDTVVADFGTLLPSSNVSGSCRLGVGAWLGTGARAIDGVTVGANVVVGAGAVVIRDVGDGCTVVGVPAKAVLKK